MRIQFHLILSVSIFYKTKFCLIFLVLILDIFFGYERVKHYRYFPGVMVQNSIANDGGKSSEGGGGGGYKTPQL